MIILFVRVPKSFDSNQSKLIIDMIAYNKFTSDMR